MGRAPSFAETAPRERGTGRAPSAAAIQAARGKETKYVVRLNAEGKIISDAREDEINAVKTVKKF